MSAPTTSLAICVFCGSSHGVDPAYAQEARELGRLIAADGHSLVFGGGGVGLMGEVARAARDGGATVTGVLPRFLEHLEPPLSRDERLVITPDLQTRKTRMLARADGFIVLPGGLGTMDEFFEVVTSAQLSVLDKPIVMLNTKGFYEPLRAMMDHIVRQGFAKPEARALYRVVDTPQEAVQAVSRNSL